MAGLRTGYQSALIALEIGEFAAKEGTDQLVLAPAVGSSVGNAAIQLARAYGAPEPITTAGSAAKAEKARALGYTRVIDLTQESLLEGVKRLTGGAGVDVALDILGGVYMPDTIAALKPGKTIVIMGGAAGLQVSFLIFDLVGPRKSMRPLNLIFEAPEVRRGALERIVSLWEAGRIHPLIDRIFPASEAAEAQRYFKEDRPLGKVLLAFGQALSLPLLPIDQHAEHRLVVDGQGEEIFRAPLSGSRSPGDAVAGNFSVLKRHEREKTVNGREEER